LIQLDCAGETEKGRGGESSFAKASEDKGGDKESPIFYMRLFYTATLKKLYQINFSLLILIYLFK